MQREGCLTFSNTISASHPSRSIRLELDSVTRKEVENIEASSFYGVHHNAAHDILHSTRALGSSSAAVLSRVFLSCNGRSLFCAVAWVQLDEL